MSEEKIHEEVELSEEKIGVLRAAYRRPVAGVVIDTIVGFERSLEKAPEEKEVPLEEEAAPAEEEAAEEEGAPEISEEEFFAKPRSYEENLRFFRSQEVKKAEEEKPAEEEEEEEQATGA